jgi:hypothetical protein
MPARGVLCPPFHRYTVQLACSAGSDGYTCADLRRSVMFPRAVDESVSSDRVYEQEVVEDRAGTRTSWESHKSSG